MNGREKANQYLLDRFRREGALTGDPERIAAEAGLPAQDVEIALAELIGANKVSPFQDDEGVIGYQWKVPYSP